MSNSQKNFRILWKPLWWIRSLMRMWFGPLRLKCAISCSQSLRIIVGAEGKSQPGWEPTEMEFLNLLNLYDWERFFEPDTVDAILAEHVWEHLSEDDGLVAAANCFRYLKQGGYLRIAVPDGLFPDSSYLEFVRPGGVGPGAEDHKVLYTYKSIGRVLEDAGFRVVIYEYFDENGEFHFEKWDTENGKIWRSKLFDPRNQAGEINFTSIVLDAFKENRKQDRVDRLKTAAII